MVDVLKTFQPRLSRAPNGFTNDLRDRNRNCLEEAEKDRGRRDWVQVDSRPFGRVGFLN